MKKFVTLIVCSVLLATQGIHAQTLLGDLLKGNVAVSGTSDSVLIDAVMPGLYIVRQQYQLRSNADGKLYGKDGNNWFGEKYSLGVKVAGGLLVNHLVMKPWVGDVDFSKVNNHGKYTPQLYKTTYLRSLCEKVYREVNLDFDTPEYMEAYGNDSLLFRHLESQADFGFLTDESFDSATGYMLWAYRDSTADYAAMKVKLRVARMRLGEVGDSLSVSCTPPDSDKAIGGVFIVPVVDRVGQISCRLAGVAILSPEGRWLLRSLIREAAPESRKKSRRNRSGRETETEKIKLSPVES